MSDTYQDETARQARDAVARADQDFTRQPRLAWDSVHDVVGHILPWQWWCLAAQTGNGKTTILMNLLDDFVAQGKRVYVLPLEQTPLEMMTIQAALECGFKVGHVLANRWHKLPGEAKPRVKAAIERRAACGLIYYDDTPALSCSMLIDVWAEAMNFGADLVMIDHIHHLAHADHKELAMVAKALTDHTKATQVPALVAAQLNRGERDALRPFLPPILQDIQGSAHIEQNAPVIFGAYRPLGECLRDDMIAVRQGLMDPYKLAKPNTVGLKLMKDRVDGEYTGRLFELDFKQGRITCPATEDRRLYEQRVDL